MLEWVLEKAMCGSPLENDPNIYKSKSISKYKLKKKGFWPCLRVPLEEWHTREKGQYGEHRLPRMLGTEVHCSHSDPVAAIHR